MKARPTFAALLLLPAFLLGCKGTGGTASDTKEAFSGHDLVSAFGGIAWQKSHLADLPTSVQLSPTPWHGYYWPSYRSGLLAHQYAETQSPLEKFEAAFATQLQSANPTYTPGMLAQLEHARIAGVTTNWFGICDGTSEAALTFPEPTQATTVGGITFYPYDIKALLGYFTAMSDPSRKFVFAGSKASSTPVSFDPDGRPLDPTYRNVNPGIFHLALANYMGIKSQGMVANVVTNGMVLNFPLIAYQVVSSTEVTDPTQKAALKKYDATAVTIMMVQTTVQYGDSHRVLLTLPGVDQTWSMTYDYTLELDANGNIIGGEWQGNSITTHPDFLWASTSGAVDVPNLKTNRLSKQLAIGTALQALLASPPDQNSDAEVQARRDDPANLAPYHIFDGWKIPSVPAEMAPLLGSGS